MDYAFYFSFLTVKYKPHS